MISKVLCFLGLLQPRTVLEVMPENKKFEKEIQFNKQSNKVTATGLEPGTTYFLNEHSTIWPNWPND